MPGRLERVASRAGVSPATVSRVLNDRPGVAAATRRAVVAALDVLGYDRPPALRARGNGLVGIVVPELENPIFPRLARAVSARLSEHRFTPVVCSQVVGEVHEDDFVQTLLGHGASGLVFVSGIHAVADTDPGRYQALLDQRTPFVLVNGAMPALAAPYLGVEEARGMGLAVAHLVGLGHRRIGLAPGTGRYDTVAARVAGFERALADHLPSSDRGPAGEVLVERSPFTIEGGAAAAVALLGRGATALVCGSDLMALGAVRAARELGRRVPEDVSVIGSDDSLVMPFVDPPLTTLRQPAEAMGADAASCLVDMMRGAPTDGSARWYVSELVVRSTTGPAPDARPAR